VLLLSTIAPAGFTLASRKYTPVAPPGTNLSTYGVTFEAILTKPAQRGQEAQS